MTDLKAVNKSDQALETKAKAHNEVIDMRDEHDEHEDDDDDEDMKAIASGMRYLVVPNEAHHHDVLNEYRGNLLTKSQIGEMPDLELRDLILKKKFGASPDRY